MWNSLYFINYIRSILINLFRCIWASFFFQLRIFNNHFTIDYVLNRTKTEKVSAKCPKWSPIPQKKIQFEIWRIIEQTINLIIFDKKTIKHNTVAELKLSIAHINLNGMQLNQWIWWKKNYALWSVFSTESYRLSM